MLSPNSNTTTLSNNLNSSNVYINNNNNTSHSNTNSDYSSSYEGEDDDSQPLHYDEEIEDDGKLIDSPTTIQSSSTTEKKLSPVQSSSSLLITQDCKAPRRCISYNLLPSQGSSHHLKPNINHTEAKTSKQEQIRHVSSSSTMVSLCIEGPSEQTTGLSSDNKALQQSSRLLTPSLNHHKYPFLSKSTSSSNLLTPPPPLSRRNSMYSVTSGRSRVSSGHLGSLVSSPRLVNTFQKITEQRKTLKNDPTFDNHLFEYESSLISDDKINLKPYVYSKDGESDQEETQPEEQLGQLGKEYATGMDPKSVMLLCDLKRNGKKIGILLDDMERKNGDKFHNKENNRSSDQHDTSIKSKVERTMQMIKHSLEQLNNGKSKTKKSTNKDIQ